MKKTYLQWFTMLDHETSMRAAANLHLSGFNLDICPECDTLSGSLKRAFPWINTTEGKEYWKQIFDKLEKKERIEKIYSQRLN